jgi:hypothetical protein
VTREQTLSHYLNEIEGGPRYANLGLDGAHPVALAGLLEHYAGGVEGKDVVLQCNPLWLSSPRHDLQESQEFHFNHPRLVPQFAPAIPCYKEQVSPRIGIVVERHVPFFAWANHLQQAYFDRTDIPTWTLERPYDNPWDAVRRGLPPPDDLLRHEPVPWTERGITKQNFPWVDPGSSLQWRFFRRAIEILQRRGNRVFVLVGPFNEHMLNETSRRRYREVKAAIEAGLSVMEIPYFAPPPLPSELYGDASHPLAAGYAALARQLSARLSRSVPLIRQASLDGP